MKIRFKGIFIGILILGLLGPSRVLARQEKFSDLKETSWYYEPVNALVDLGHIDGYLDHSFRPNDKITFGEFLKIIMSASRDKTYKHIPNKHWAYDAYIDASLMAVIDPENFKGDYKSLDSSLSREDMAYIIIGVDENIFKTRANTLKLKSIKDIDLASSLSRDSIYAAYNRGYIQGNQGYFRPKDQLSRAEASQVIYSFLQAKNKLK